MKLELQDSTAKGLRELLRTMRPLLKQDHADLIESYEYAYLQASRDAEEEQHGGKIVVSRMARRIDQLIAFMRTKSMPVPRTSGVLVAPKNRRELITDLEAQIDDAGHKIPEQPED